MVRGTRAFGKTIELTEKVHFSMPTETFTMDCGSMTKLMDKASTDMHMELFTKASGLKISSMVEVLKPGPMVQSMKDSTETVKRMEKALYTLLMEVFSRVSFLRTK